MSDIQNFWPEWHQMEAVGSGSSGRVFSIVRSDGQREESAIMKVIETQDDPAAVEQRVRSVMALRFGPNMLGLDAYHLEPVDGQNPTTLYMRSEYLPSLEQMGLPKQEEAVRLGIEISSALSFCEEHGTIHGNIKPSNIFRSQYGSFKLGDFMICRGISSIDQNAVRTSIRYQAPEVLSGMSFSYNAELYSLGLILYRCFNHGRFPYEPSFTLPLKEQDSVSADSTRNGGAQLPMPDDCDRSLGEIILRALQWSPMNRYDSAASLRSDLIAWQNGARAISAYIPAQHPVADSAQNSMNPAGESVNSSEQNSMNSADQPVTGSAQNGGNPADQPVDGSAQNSDESANQSAADLLQSGGIPAAQPAAGNLQGSGSAAPQSSEDLMQNPEEITGQSASAPAANKTVTAAQDDIFPDDEDFRNNGSGEPQNDKDTGGGRRVSEDLGTPRRRASQSYRTSDNYRISEGRGKTARRRRSYGNGRRSRANPLVIIFGIVAAAVICGLLFYFFLII